MNRDELIEAGYAAMDVAERSGLAAPLLGIVLDTWEPLIRADERERTNTVGGHRQIRDEGRADMCADLRAKVKALQDRHAARLPDANALEAMAALNDVLALLDGVTDD